MAASSTIGRFQIIKQLGSGGQGTVYQAHDPQLNRTVAIKTLRKLEHQAELLLNEAQLVSQLNHPNIVTLYDAGEHENIPYLVYAYIEGQTLGAYIKQFKQLPLTQAAQIARAVLDALSCAHEHKIIHLDIKPDNVLLDSKSTPMVMDFGLAQLTSDIGQVEDFTLSGTPRYIAPELIAGQPGTFLADIYSVGTLLYEMVTGKHAVQGKGLYEVLHRAANERINAPSSENQLLDEHLESIILKAVDKDPQRRYASAADMREALNAYLNKHNQQHPEGSPQDNSTLGFLHRRMQSKQDFPTISTSIAEINRIVSSETSSTSRLTSIILQDFSLTSKLLKVVNAAVFAQFGGAVNTISKAVTILGFESVRNIAASLILIEFLQNKSQASQLKEEISTAILASIVALQLAVGRDIKDPEEVMLCAMFYNLGKLLTSYCFFEESLEIQRLIEQGENEDRATKKVLGINYHELGRDVAQHWHFSNRLQTGMAKLDNIHKPEDELATLSLAVNLANEVCDEARTSAPEQKNQVIARLLKKYRAGLSDLSSKKLSKSLEVALNEFTERAKLLGMKLDNTPFLEKIRVWNGQETTDVSTEDEAHQHELSTIAKLDSTLKSKEEELEAYRKAADSEHILGAGIQDITNTLIGDFTLNDILPMILESIHRGLQFNRTILLTRDSKAQRMTARYGLGADVENIVPLFKFPLSYSPDVFHLAISKGNDIAIENTMAANIVNSIPDWYKKRIDAPCFLLLPVTIKEKAMCLFYADMKQPNSLHISKQQLTLLRTLRNQAVLAIKQKV